MKEDSSLEEQKEITQNFYSPQLMSFQSPSLDLYPLSPIRFEESSLVQLWNDVPSSPPPQSLSSYKTGQPLVTYRSKNGLKGLSWRIKEVVEYLGSANYKEVADELLNTLEIPQTASPMKDEKNVRRRVYDALNVLVAADFIKKDGKMVYPIGAITSKRFFDPNDPLKQKRDRLKELTIKYIALKNLFERNSMHNKVSGIIPFPLYIVAVPADSDYEVKMHNGPVDVTARVLVDGEFEVIQDADLLRRMGLQIKQNDIPQEIRGLFGRIS